LTDTPDPTPPATEADGEERDDDRSVTELLEQLGRELGLLALREGELEASRNMPEVRRATRDVVGGLLVAVALLTAFALVNVAAVVALSAVVPTWLASLVLAGAWLAVGGVLLLGLLGRARGRRLWSVFTARPTEAIEKLERSRDEAVDAVRATLALLAPAIAVELASAAIPDPGEMADGAVEVGEDLLEASEEIVEAIAEELPAGSVINQIWDVALMPGRFGLRVATTVLKRDGTRG
jgi:hypothetical protein